MEVVTNFKDGFRINDWEVVGQLVKGGYGSVYKVQNKTKGLVAAMKTEPYFSDVDYSMKMELSVMKQLTLDGDKPHIPTLFHAARHKNFCYMVMTLLGDNLLTLKKRCNKEVMTPQTWTRLGIQCLYSVKFIHDNGYVHRDIKTNNFAIGHETDPARCRIVHILDFGLARSYASSENGVWTARLARGSAEFRGTLRYCSPNVHEKKEQGRRDDIWSLVYVLIELHSGLPWETEKDENKLELMKMYGSDKDLVLNFPVELHGIVPYLRTLDYYQRPDYSMFYDGLVAIMKRLNVKPSDPYDWETEKKAKSMVSKSKEPHNWENATEFFKSDPIKINSPPIPGALGKAQQGEAERERAEAD